MFLPVIHNLQPSDPAFKAAQHYNALVGNRPKGKGTLADKLAAINAWQGQCREALRALKSILEDRELEVSVDAMPPAKYDDNLPVITAQHTI